MGGFLGIGGSSQKTDRGRELGGWNAEWNVFNAGLPLATSTATAGQGTTSKALGSLDTAGDFWKDLLSGNKTSTAQAAAPITNAAVDQADAARREQAAMGTSRGGGVAAGNQQAQQNTMKTVDNAIFGVRPQAAAQIGDIGKSVASIGYQQTIAALQAYGMSLDAAKSIVDSSITSRPQSNAINQQTQSQLGSVAGTILGSPAVQGSQVGTILKSLGI